MPVFTVPGNHEIFGIERHLSLVSPQHPLYGKRMYRHYLGPSYYSFSWGGVRFVGLDTADWTTSGTTATSTPISSPGSSATRTAWRRGPPVVTFNHIPLASAVERAERLPGGAAGAQHDPGRRAVPCSATWCRTRTRYWLGSRGRLELALGGHMHVRESLAYAANGRTLRFHQSAAVVAPSKVAGLSMTSGFTLYRVEDGKVDDGTFVPLDEP